MVPPGAGSSLTTVPVPTEPAPVAPPPETVSRVTVKVSASSWISSSTAVKVSAGLTTTDVVPAAMVAVPEVGPL